MSKGKRLDADSAAALAIVKAEEINEKMAAAAKKKQGDIVARLYESAGKIKATNFFATQANFLVLVQLKQMKSTGEYKELGLTWPQVCEGVGLKWRTVDDHLAQLKDFKDEFLTAAVNLIGVDFSKFKYLGDAAFNGAVKIEGGAIHYDGQVIPVDAEHAEDIEALLDNLSQAAEDARGEAKAQERITKQKQNTINKLEKALARYEERAAERGLTPEEDAFLTQMENLRLAFEGGYMPRLDPEQMEDLGDDATVIMKAEYLTTLWRMKAQVVAFYNTAVDMYGAGLVENEDTWSPSSK